MTKEFGIACLLDSISRNELINHVPFIEKRNIPHISLFQFRSNDLTFIKQIQKTINNLIISKEFDTLGVSVVENNIFLNIKDDYTLKKASDELAECYALHCNQKECLSQIQLHDLDLEAAELIKNYGIYWIKQNFNPHVTILYGKKIDEAFKLRTPKVIKILPPEIFEIDCMGRIWLD